MRHADVDAGPNPLAQPLDVAQAERPAPGVGVARVPRRAVEGLPRPAAGVPDQALDRAVLGHHEPGEGRAGLGVVAVGDLAGARRHLVREHVGVLPHLGHAVEPKAVPRARTVLLRAAVPHDVLRKPGRLCPSPVWPGGRVVGRPPRREVPLGSGPQILAGLHAGQQGVRRMVERLPQDGAAVPVAEDDQVAGMQQPRHRRSVADRVRGPDDLPGAVWKEEPPGVAEHQHAGGVIERPFPVGHPAHGGLRDGEPYPRYLRVVTPGEKKPSVKNPPDETSVSPSVMLRPWSNMSEMQAAGVPRRNRDRDRKTRTWLAIKLVIDG